MISGPSSYLPTVVEFLGHWAEVNEALGSGAELVLVEGGGRDDLDEQRGALEEARDRVTDAGVDRAEAREVLNDLIKSLQARLVEFNGRLRADLPGKPLARILPAAFSFGDAESAVRDTLRQMTRLWTKVNAISPVPPALALPLKLQGAYTLALFIADREALRLAYQALSDAEVELREAREVRNDVQEVIYPILKNYRLKVPTVFPAGHALIESMPKLTPDSGRTPVAVVATGVWDGAQEKAKLTWTASTDADLKEYQVRGVPGDDYQADDEAVLATVLAGAVRELFTPFALAEPGVTAGFKVYVILKSGHEAGSSPVFVTRPEV